MTTTAFAMKKKLVQEIKDLAFVDSVSGATMPIWYGYEGAAGERPREVVWVGEIEWRSEEAVSFGGGDPKREEEYEIVLTIEVHQIGYTQQQANDRAEVLMGYIEGMLANPRWHGMANIVSSGLRPQLLGEGQDPDGRGAIQVNTVRVRARK